jgi:hypothetical protein
MDERQVLVRLERKPGTTSGWWIFGLNTLLFNRVPGVDDLLPFREWSRCLLDEQTVAVLIGGCAVESEGWPDALHECAVEVKTTFYAGRFYDGTQNPIAGRFVRGVTPGYLVSEPFDLYLEYDALVVLVGIQDQNSVIEILNSFSSEEETLYKLSESCRQVIFSQGDAQYLEVWGGSEADLLKCCERAAAVVQNTTWYQRSECRLGWNEDLLCYTLGS